MFYPDVLPMERRAAHAAAPWRIRAVHEPLMSMLILAGVVFWLGFILWHQDLLQALYSSDRSRICYLISVVFLAMLVHCLIRAVLISGIANDTMRLEQALHRRRLHLIAGTVTDANGVALPLCPALQLLQEKLNPQAEFADGDAAEKHDDTRNWMYERIGRSNQIGWFCADIMIKLGLLGTIVGFVFMLGSITTMQDVDTNAMRVVLQQMGSGMSTALLTTMAGLGCSMILGVMYFVLDHYATALVDSNHSLFDQARNCLRQQPPATETAP